MSSRHKKTCGASSCLPIALRLYEGFLGGAACPTRTPLLRLVQPHVLGARLRAPSEPQEALRLAH